MEIFKKNGNFEKKWNFMLLRLIFFSRKNAGSLFIPRQRLLLAFVHRNWIQLYAYNCSRDVNEKLNKQISNLGAWFAARSALSMSLVAQKCGLFHHQPFY